ncbi:cobalamin-dependent protein [bacterium]|nr:cobalamin-dependent protein [bacterium]
MENLDLKNIKPYGDTLNDGIIQMSFTLPVPPSGKSKEAAKLYLEKIGYTNVYITTMEKAGESFSFFVAYAKHNTAINFEEIDVPEIEVKIRSMKEIDNLIEKYLKRALRVVGACTGSDAHSVGIDAIMNMKGYSGDYGLERYKQIDAYNLGAQVKNIDLIEYAKQIKADAILVSQVVTQKNIHIQNAKDFIKKAQESGVIKDTILILGGPRVDHKLALSLGFHAGFGPGSKPSTIANYILEEKLKRESIEI